MKLVIIPSDGAVYKDGVYYSHLSLQGIPEEVHALQWSTNVGWIEFKNTSEFSRPPNESIGVLPEWAIAALLKWDEAKAAQDAAVSDAAIQAEGSVNELNAQTPLP